MGARADLEKLLRVFSVAHKNRSHVSKNETERYEKVTLLEN
jgi:hypothetical protein